MNTILIARYKSDYDEVPTFTIIGIFSIEKQLNAAIDEYKRVKIKNDAEILLENTEFIKIPCQVDAIGNGQSLY